MRRLLACSTTLVVAVVVAGCGGKEDMSTTQLADEMSQGLGGATVQCEVKGGTVETPETPGDQGQAYNRTCEVPDGSVKGQIPVSVHGDSWCVVGRDIQGLRMC
jgi:hypothetical protein